MESRCAALAKILIVDGHHYFRRQLRNLIEAQVDWEVCCEAVDGHEAVAKHGEVQPHLTVMDFGMPGMDGLRASRMILGNCPKAVILMVTVFLSQQFADEAKKVGIKGYCSKGETDCIVLAIEKLLEGGSYYPEIVN